MENTYSKNKTQKNDFLSFKSQPFNDSLLNSSLRPNYMNNNSKEDILQLANQYLNLKDYPETPLGRVPILLDISMETLKDKTSLDFRASIIRSIYSYLSGEYTKILDTLDNNNPDSFVLYQLSSKDHAFSSIARQTSEGISLTVGNKGETANYNTFEEFMFKDKESLGKAIKTVGLGESQNLSINDVYDTIKSMSTSHYTLKVSSRDQKINNCAIKNTQALVKYAYSTRNFTSDHLKKLRSKDTITFKPKWEPSTKIFHKKLTDKLQKVNPDCKSNLIEKLKKYEERKNSKESMPLLNR